MSEERKRILELLAAGKITADEAERLLNAVESQQGAVSAATDGPAANARKPRFLHIKVEGEPGGNSKHENVNIRIPIMLLKAGLKLSAVLPEKARARFSSHLNDKGLDLDLNKLDPNTLEELLLALTESTIEVDSDKEKVRIYCA